MSLNTTQEIDKVLHNFSQQLRPPKQYISDARKAVDTIVRRLQEKSRFGIDRPYTGGSMGKKTSVIYSDCDEVLMVNIDSIAKIKDVLDDFEAILDLHPPGRLSEIERRRFSLQFTFNDFEIDLLPAINFVQGQAQQPENPTLAAQQALRTLLKIREDPQKAYHYSTALVESSLRFMEEQSENIHNLVRICKLWNKSLLIDQKISGRSSLIELIAAYAGKQEEHQTSEQFSLFRGFQTFLRLMENFPQLNIVDFGFDPLKGSGYSIHQLTGGQRPIELQKQPGKALVIEPANPYNNIAQGVKDPEVKKFQAFAKETLRRLEEYVTRSKVSRIPLDDIFAPQPVVIPYMTAGQINFFRSARFLVGAKVETGLLAPSMDIRNEDKYKGRDMQAALRHFQTLFLVTCQGFVSSFSTNVGSRSVEQLRSDLQEKVQKSIDGNVRGASPSNWVSATGDRHENREVTLTIPCHCQFRGEIADFVVRVSFSSG